jgi:hypothetical protein
MGSKVKLEEKWRQQSEAAKLKAATLPPGRDRDELLRIARQLDTASHMNEWLSSPGLAPPK